MQTRMSSISESLAYCGTYICNLLKKDYIYGPCFSFSNKRYICTEMHLPCLSLIEWSISSYYRFLCVSCLGHWWATSRKGLYCNGGFNFLLLIWPVPTIWSDFRFRTFIWIYMHVQTSSKNMWFIKKKWEQMQPI
jgi:hypothetical protein